MYSFNVNGLRDTYKRKTVLTHIKTELKGIIMLQETHTCIQIEKSWSDLTGAKCYFSHGKTDSRGVAVLITPDTDIKVKKVTPDVHGRFILLETEYEGTDLILLNVYSPTKDKRKEQLLFIEQISNLLEEHLDKRIVLAGDQNICLQPELDKKGGANEKESESRVKLTSLIEYYDLVDIWRIRNPDTHKFTWRGKTRGGLVQSRIDYFLVSASIADLVQSVDITHGICSDHSMLCMSLGTNGGRRGKGLWKFNTSLLKDRELTSLIKVCIQDLRIQYSELTDKGLLWDLIKCKMRGLIIGYASKKHKKNREYEELLVKEITKKEEMLAQGNESIVEELESLKAEYDSIQKERAQGAILRSKVDWAEHGEKNTRFFLQLEKRNFEVKHIKTLITEKGQLDKPKDILEAEKDYYAKLYTEDIDKKFPLESSLFLDDKYITKVTPDLAINCDNPVTLEECQKALSTMSNNKTPGSDGFSGEFYKFFWEEIKDLVLGSFSYAFKVGRLSIDQRRGVISLIPKKGKDVRFLKNWRPISLLNTDYKILTKVLASRLQEALNVIISPDQTGYIKGRYIGENVRLIDDIIHHTTVTHSKGYLVLLDFEKAFDSVNIDFLRKALQVYSFGPQFRKWIDVLYSEVNSCVTNNGHISEFFSLTRGIRQGCPISAMLFLVVVELLSVYIKNCPDIKGLTIDKETFVITQLADDTTLFLNDEASIYNLLCVMDRFYESSGLRLNKQKCEVFALGSCGQCNNIPNNIAGLKSVTGAFKALGIYFGKDQVELMERNFEQRINSCQVLLNIWLQRGLSLKGKITVLKSIIVPNLLYASSNLYIPSMFINRINVMFFKFLWNNKPAKIKQSTIIADIEQGGLKMPHFHTIVQSSKVMWIKRLLSPMKAQWKKLAFNVMNVSRFQLYCKNEAQFINTASLFYKQVLDAWYNFHSTEPSTVEEITTEVLWNNKFIKIDNKPVYYSKWHVSGITYFQDLLNKNGKLLTRVELMRLHNLSFTTLEYLSLVNAIPKQWFKEIHKSCVAKLNDVQTKMESKIMMLTSQKVYWKLLGTIVKQPTATEQWISLFPFLHDNDFCEIYKIPNNITNVKLQSFQYKLLNRIVPCNYNLHKWSIVQSPNCNLCKNVDTLEHYFFYCNQSKRFWSSVERWLVQMYEVNIPLKITDVLFGIPYKKTQDDIMPILNFVIMYGKWFIYTQRQDKREIFFLNFLQYLKHVLKIEEQVSINKNKHDVFCKRWSTFML